MEWVETTGATVEDAKERALDQLGVLAEDAEFEVIEEPKQGLFGRIRGEARVRARVRPTQARQKIDRRDRRKGERPKGDRSKADRPSSPPTEGGEAGPASGRQRPQKAPQRPAAPKQRAQGTAKADSATTAADAAVRRPTKEEQQVDAQQVGLEAQKFLEGLVSAFGLSGQVELGADGDDLELRVQGEELGLLVGPRGTTLQAVQDLTRVASQRRLGDHDTRLRVDVGGYRERRAAALGAFAMKMADEVVSSGVARVLEPMSSADRKVIHDALTDVAGIETRSEGDDPHRRVVIAPANG